MLFTKRKRRKAHHVVPKRKRKPAATKAVHKKPAPAKPKPITAPKPVQVPTKPVKPAPAPTSSPPPAVPPVPAPTTPLPPDVPPTLPGGPVDVYAGPFGARQAERLLWRAGFGPRPGDVARLASMSLTDAVHSLTRPSGDATLIGPAPHSDTGPLDPVNQWGDDQLWWLDRMVRSDQPLVERMTLVWHDWFATSNDQVGKTELMLGQNATLRRLALGSFKDLAFAVTADPAMLVQLNGTENRAGAPNENYGRELMELFTLGADRGAYTEADVKEQARSLTGWRADWIDPTGWGNFRFDPRYHDTKPKTVFGQTGNWDWQSAVELCLRHDLHRSFFVLKLWSYFIPTPPDATTQQALEKVYRESGYSIRDTLEAILMHPALYTGGALVKPPVVHTAGLLRALGRGVDRNAWWWHADDAGQRLFYPPNVSGWDDSRWLNTNTLYGRSLMVYYALEDRWINTDGRYSQTQTPQQAVDAAIAFWGSPTLTPETLSTLLAFATASVSATATGASAADQRALRQNALRHLVAISPDYQTS